MSFNDDTSQKHKGRDNARTVRDHRSSAPSAPARGTSQPRRSALTALPDMNPYHHGPSRFTETFSSTPLRGQRVTEARHEQQATPENPLRFSQRFAPPGIRDLSAARSEYESQAIPSGPSYSEPRPARASLRQPHESQSVTMEQQYRQLISPAAAPHAQQYQQQYIPCGPSYSEPRPVRAGLHQSQEFQDMAREQQYQQPIPPATVPRAQQYQQRDTPPINAPRGPTNPHRHQYRHTLAPDFRPTTPTPPPRSGNRSQQQRQDVSQYRPTHAHAQTQVVPADIYSNASASQRPLPRHIIGRPCPLGDRNCHHHHGVPCHQYWEHCPLARKAISASFLAHNPWRGAPEGWNKEHERCVATDATPGDMCVMHRRLYTDALPAVERSLLGTLLQE